VGKVYYHASGVLSCRSRRAFSTCWHLPAGADLGKVPYRAASAALALPRRVHLLEPLIGVAKWDEAEHRHGLLGRLPLGVRGAGPLRPRDGGSARWCRRRRSGCLHTEEKSDGAAVGERESTYPFKLQDGPDHSQSESEIGGDAPAAHHPRSGSHGQAPTLDWLRRKLRYTL